MTIQGFDNFEDMLQALEEQGREAKRQADNLRPFLENFRKPGTCFLQIHPSGYWIYGKVEDLEDEDQDDKEMIEAAFQDGYLYCRAASQLCPRGELGTIHVSNVVAILTPDLYEQAYLKGWPGHPWIGFREGILAYNPNMERSLEC